MHVDLIWLGSARVPAWSFGEAHAVEPEPRAMHNLIENHIARSGAEFCLFWDESLGAPDSETVRRAAALPGDVWHAGLKLGMAGAPGMIDFVAPTWMLNRDPDADIEATSWRISLRACLLRTEVLKRMGGVRPEFVTLEGAALEMGHRYVTRGVLTRNVPWLLGHGPVAAEGISLPVEDELRFVYYRYGKFWGRWALGRALATRYSAAVPAMRAAKRVFATRSPADPEPFTHELPAATDINMSARISVLIPTLDRQDYLRKLLEQLRCQTVRPYEIIVVDQTPTEQRDPRLSSDFADLPLRMFYLDHPGQCSSRNFGLQRVEGDYVFFADDDEEIEPNLFEIHLRNLHLARDEVSSGVIHEVGAGPLPKNFTFTRVSDVFPMGNTLINREVLRRSGLLDLAYERGQRADGDLGMRVYLSGALMVLNPAASVLHHHAARGGLRAHKARVVTYASSRQQLTVRHLPSVTEIYLARRYYTARQVREMLWLRAAGTFAIRDRKHRKILKAVISLLSLPDTLRQIGQRCGQVRSMLESFPQIGTLEGGSLNGKGQRLKM